MVPVVVSLAAVLLVVGRAAVTDPGSTRSAIGHDLMVTAGAGRDLALPPVAAERRVEIAGEHPGRGRSDLLGPALLAVLAGAASLGGGRRRAVLASVGSSARRAGRAVSTRAPPLAVA